MPSVIRTALFAAFLFAAPSLLSFGTSTATVLTQITNTPYLDAGPSWSPDGTRIAIGSERTGSLQIWLIDADGSNPVQLTNSPGDKVGHTWSADGQWIVYATSAGGAEEFYRIPVTGGSPVLISGNSWRDLEPDWAPSGSWVIGHAFLNSNWDVAVYDGLAGGLVHLATTHPALDAEPDFSPTLDRIIFRSDRDGGNDIYIAPLPAGHQGTRITLTPGDDIQPSWSTSHDLIALASDRLWADRSTLPGDPSLEALGIEQSDIWITDEAGIFVVPVTDDGLFNYAPSWSPDGTRIAFHSHRNGNWDVFIADDLPINTPVEPATWGGMKARFRDE